jgi:CBS domain-containing protein
MKPTGRRIEVRHSLADSRGKVDGVHTPISVVLERQGHKLFSISPSTTILDAVQEMTRQHIGCIAVMEGAELVGIFTERDVMTRVVAKAVDPKAVRVGEVMTANPDTITPDVTVQQVMEIFNQKRFRHIPVVSGGRVLGIVSIRNLSDWIVAAHRAEAEQLLQYITGSQQFGT